MSTPTAPDSREADSTWREMQRLLDEVAALARTQVDEPRFMSGLLDCAVRVTAAVGGIVWTRTDAERFQPAYHRHAQRVGLASDPHAQQLHARVLEGLEPAGGTTWIAAGAGASTAEGAYLNRELTLSFTPLAGGARTFAVLELFHEGADDPSLQRACERLFTELAAAARVWQQSQQAEVLEHRERFLRAADRFARDVHAQLDLSDTMVEVVNEGRRLLECDRVWLALRDGDRFEVRAISGVEEPDRRTGLVRSLESLATVAARWDEPLEWGRAPRELPPEIARPLEAFLDVAASRWLMTWPLRRTGRDASQRGEVFGLLVAEKLTGDVPDELPARLEIVVAHAGLALANAWEYSTLPGVAWLRWLRASLGLDRSRRRRRLMLAAVVCGALAACALLPVNFTIEARGVLQPRVVRDLFAPLDGEVDQVLVKHEQRVAPGQTLLTLRSTSLELERRRLDGELEATRQRLLAVESARLTQASSGREGLAGAAPGGSLSATEEELRGTAASLEEQLKILDEQRASLAVKSPVTGTVLTWNLDELLAARPVQRGQVLLRLGETSGAWEARLDVSDRRIGHVLDAQRSRGNDLPVEFGLAMAPGVRYAGHVDRVAGVTETDETGRPCVRVFVALDPTLPTDPRPGATVVARIHCGRRSVLYVWLHEVWEFVQAQFFF